MLSKLWRASYLDPAPAVSIIIEAKTELLSGSLVAINIGGESANTHWDVGDA